MVFKGFLLIILMQRLILVVIITVGILGLIYNWAFAYVIDGYLEDWGISRYVYNSNKYWIDNWYPSDSDIDRRIHDNFRETGHPMADYGGEKYDVEALYFDDDPHYLYFAMITSFPMTGRMTASNSVVAGDLAIDFTGAPLDDYKYGLKIKGIPSSKYGLSSRELSIEPEWFFNGHGQGPVYMTDYGDFAGLGEIYYWNAHEGGYLKEPPGNSYHTWILEGRINRLFFSPIPQEGDSIKLHWAMTCGNDYIDLNGDFDTVPVPEPTTLSLLGLGLLGLVGLRRKKVA